MPDEYSFNTTITMEGAGLQLKCARGPQVLNVASLPEHFFSVMSQICQVACTEARNHLCSRDTQ